jgi:hypothetical protein
VFLNASSISSGFRGPTSGSSAHPENKKPQKYEICSLGLRTIIGGTQEHSFLKDQELIFWFLN